MYLCYDKPAEFSLNGLNSQALPLGNGKIGAKIFGGVENEMIAFNESGLFSGSEKSFGSYQALGEIIFSFGESVPFSENSYIRDLDIMTASAMVACQKGIDGVNKHFFVSEKDNALIGKIESTGDNLLDFSVSLQSEQRGSIAYASATGTIIGTVNANNGVDAQMGEDANAVSYGVYMKITAPDGVIETNEDSIHVSDCFQAYVYLSCCSRKNGTPGEALEKAEQAVEICSGMDFKTLFKRHLEEYRKGLGKLKLNVGQTEQNTTTNRLLKLSQKGKFKNEIPVTLFEYGLYLYSCSVCESSVMNENGIWNGLNCPLKPIGINTRENKILFTLARYTNTDGRLKGTKEFHDKFGDGVFNYFGLKGKEDVYREKKKGLFSKPEITDLRKLKSWVYEKDEKNIEKLFKALPEMFSDNLIPQDIFSLFSYCDGIFSMFIRNENDCISLLPYLPERFGTGNIKGLSCDGIDIALEWDKGKYTSGEIISRKDGSVALYAQGRVILVYDENNNEIPCTYNDRTVTFNVQKDKKYFLK